MMYVQLLEIDGKPMSVCFRTPEEMTEYVRKYIEQRELEGYHAEEY